MNFSQMICPKGAARNTLTNTFKHHLTSFSYSSTTREELSVKLKNGPQLSHFINQSNHQSNNNHVFVKERNNIIPYIDEKDIDGCGRKVHIKTYGCQMNVNDTQIASSILENAGYKLVNDINQAEIIFLMTCAIRENAELKIWNKLRQLSALKRQGKVSQIGLLGCMAERLKTNLLNKQECIDIISGPDSYRDLPKLMAINKLTGQKAVNVLLSMHETYSEVMPTITTSSMSAFVSIMRGCDNMCSYCIVPFTRGRERSRSIDSILEEVSKLSSSGIKEVTLLGQNVNSYRDTSDSSRPQSHIGTTSGFQTIYKRRSGGTTFDILLDEVAKIDPEMRIRFTSPHPKDFPDEVLHVINSHHNIAKCIHLPAQSGSNDVLKRMRRGYTKEAYLSLVDRIKQIIPDCSLTSDFICGFCGETQKDHEETLDLVQRVPYSNAYIFSYSMREKTHAFHNMTDDVPQQVKIDRVSQLMQLYRSLAHQTNTSLIGKQQIILIEGQSKRSQDDLSGRNEANVKVIVPKQLVPQSNNDKTLKSLQPGDYVVVQIQGCTSQTLMATPLYHSTLTDYYQNKTNCS